MNILDLLRQIIPSLWSRKLRSALALFGIVWGTIAVVLLLALSTGFYNANQKSLEMLASGTILVWPGVSSKSFQGAPAGQEIHIKMHDVINLADNIPAIRSVAPVVESGVKWTSLHYQKKTLQANVRGVTPSHQLVQKFRIAKPGRFINPLDVQQQRRVVFLGDGLKETLFGKEPAEGKTLFINDIPFLVIGVLDVTEGGMFNFTWDKDQAFIPYTTHHAIWGQDDVSNLLILPKDFSQAAQLKQDVRSFLSTKYHFDPTDDQAIGMPNFEEMLVFFKWFFRCIELFLGFCGAMTLAVGGIGVANIMFLIVTERMHEIGLLMALGAERKHIMQQFMLESLLLVLLGGAIGLVISSLVLALLHHLPLPSWIGHPTLSGFVVCVTIFILALVALVAGYFPARRAANLQPVVALSVNY